MRSIQQKILDRKVRKEAEKIHYYDVWSLREISLPVLLSETEDKSFIRDVYLCFLKRYPTGQEYETILGHLENKRCSREDVVKMVQGFEESKQYAELRLIE